MGKILVISGRSASSYQEEIKRSSGMDYFEVAHFFCRPRMNSTRCTLLHINTLGDKEVYFELGCYEPGFISDRKMYHDPLLK